MNPAEVDRLWEDAVRRALLGTERQPSAAASADSGADASALGRALAGLEGRGEEARLLGTAAVASLYRRAGRLPRKDAGASLKPAPEETARRAPPAAARLLASMLAGEHASLLPEWLAYAAAREVVVPEELLPALLDAASAKADMRDAAAAVIGARGRWLAARYDGWAWATVGGVGPGAEVEIAPDHARAGWETATGDVRRVMLRRVRRADPALGLELVRSTWSADSPKDRAAFLETLEDGLSDADEPFLEAALDDKRKEVRRAAAELLSRIPASRLAARMTERARALVRISTPSGGLISKLTGAKPEITLDLPPECTKEMVRDGVELKPPAGAGERAWWLRQLVAAVPPAVWSADAAPDVWVDAAARAHDGKVLLDAWTTAAVRYRDAAWADALIRAGRWNAGGDQSSLVALVSPERFREQVLRLLGAGGRTLSGDALPIRLIVEAPHTMGPELTRALLARLTPAAAAGDYVLRDVLRPLAAKMDPAAALDVLSGWKPQPRGGWIDLLHVRHALNEAFAS